MRAYDALRIGLLVRWFIGVVEKLVRLERLHSSTGRTFVEEKVTVALRADGCMYRGKGDHCLCGASLCDFRE